MQFGQKSAKPAKINSCISLFFQSIYFFLLHGIVWLVTCSCFFVCLCPCLLSYVDCLLRTYVQQQQQQRLLRLQNYKSDINCRAIYNLFVSAGTPEVVYELFGPGVLLVLD